MTHLPKLAIVGRPNVGKSALFNRICKKKIAIVDEAEGITRDRLYSKADIFGTPFEVIDTGGMDYQSHAVFNEHILRQAEIAIEEADTIVMVVDAHVGITKLDKDIARVLLKTKKPVCLAVNKIDNSKQETLLHEFHSLGIKKMVPVSAAQGWHIAEVLEAAFETLDKKTLQVVDDPTINVAIVGRPNVGKSSLINYLLDEERCIVSPIPGTTRDSIDVTVTHEGEPFRFIDTAGVRRKHAEHEVVDKFAAIRTERAIERADICVLMLDAEKGMTAQDKKIANMIEEAGKGCILVFNKWDLVKGFRMEHCLKDINDEVAFLRHCPKLFTSATTGRNVEKLFPLIKEVHVDSMKRITTHQLNKFIESSMQKNHPPMIQGKRLRVYYMAQVSIQPPKFVLFVNYPNLMLESYKKYLYNQFRETYGFVGVPLTFHMKGKKKATKEERLSNKKVEKVPAKPEDDDDQELSEEDDFNEGDYLFENEDEL